jgi:hypothetical protein
VLTAAIDGPCASRRAGGAVIAVERQNVEGVELYLVIVLAGMQRVGGAFISHS